VLTISIAVNTIRPTGVLEELLASRSGRPRTAGTVGGLQRTNAELEDKAKLLSEQKGNIETKNREIELARLGLEDKAQQLTRASAYKSEFLANIATNSVRR
jgi:hypothetical protein